MKKLLFSIIALVVLVPAFGFAADVRNAEVVTKDENVTNLYLAGQNPSVDANVRGDLVVAGGNVTVNGNVEDGVIAAGGTLNLNGSVGQSVRVAGGNVNVNGTIGGDLIVFGGNVIVGSKSVVTGDVIVFAGNVEIQGLVKGAVKNSAAGTIIIAGTVSGNVELYRVGNVKVTGKAVIDGTLKYSSQNTADIADSAKLGNVDYTKVAPVNMPKPNPASIIFGLIVALVMGFLALLLVVSLMPKLSKEVINASLVNPWAKLGIGFLALVVTPIVLIMLLITFIGWGVMGIVAMVYFGLITIAGVFSALLVGSYTWKFFSKEKEMQVNWKTVAVGILILAVVKLIPILGWLAVCVVFLIVFGTLTTMGYNYIKAQRA